MHIQLMAIAPCVYLINSQGLCVYTYTMIAVVVYSLTKVRPLECVHTCSCTVMVFIRTHVHVGFLCVHGICVQCRSVLPLHYDMIATQGTVVMFCYCVEGAYVEQGCYIV